MTRCIKILVTALFVYFIGTATCQITSILDRPSSFIIVQVSGQVNKPGKYHLPFDSRAVDAIQIAGGATYNAKLETINLAQKLVDKDEVYVP